MKILKQAGFSMSVMCVLLFLVFGCSTKLYAQEVKVQVPSDFDKPEVKSLYQTGGTINLAGIFPRIKLHHVHPEKTLIFKGHFMTCLYGFEGEAMLFNPQNPPARTSTPLDIMDSSNIVVQDLEVWGGVNQAVSLMDSYPELGGLYDVTLKNIVVRYADQRGVFAGGHLMYKYRLENIIVRETCYTGNVTHGFYLSGGIWGRKDASGNLYPPIHDVEIINCISGVDTGRHGLQINGRFENVLIDGGSYFFNQLCGISLIGVQDCIVQDVLFHGNNRSPIVIYMDPFDPSYWDPDFHLEPGEDLDTKKNNKWSWEHWVATHHPNGNIAIQNCTMITGPTKWHQDAIHQDDPIYFPVVDIKNEIHGEIFGGVVMDFPPGRIDLHKNIMIAPRETMIRFASKYDAFATRVFDNLMFTGNGKSPSISLPGYFSPVPELQENPFSGQWYGLNVWDNPQIKIPKYPCIDKTKVKVFNFEPMFLFGEKQKLEAGSVLGKCYGAKAVSFKEALGGK